MVKLLAALGLLPLAMLAIVPGAAQKPMAGSAHKPAGCAAVEFNGAADRGETFSQPLGHGLLFRLRAIPSGWRIEVLPAKGAGAPHDLAEIATPPYASPSPLLLSTDFSFRAQDAAGWSPRAFRFLTTDREQAPLSSALDSLVAKPKSQAEAEKLLAATAHAAPGELRITHVAYTPGTADIAGTAAGVTSHLRFTPQDIRGDKASPLGVLDRVEFTVTLGLDPGSYKAPGLSSSKMDCDGGAAGR